MADITFSEKFRNHMKGEIEFIVKDKNGRVLNIIREPNLIKIFAKEIISHRIGYGQIWDPDAGTDGAWVTSGIDEDEDLAVKYILFGASFDEDGTPLGSNDPRFYTQDTVTGTPIPINLEVAADYQGGLINAIPISEPDRPLKRIEAMSFEPTYQPAGTPLLQAGVRAMNNIAVFDTTITVDEYNGFGSTSDYFTITEVALAAGKTLNSVGACEETPREIFLEGVTGTDGDEVPIPATATGGDVVSIDDVANAELIKEGDQIKIVSQTVDSSGAYSTLGQVNPFYLVLSKSSTGLEMQLDRVPCDSTQSPISGSVGVYRDTLRIFSHRILTTPFSKTPEIEVTCRWRIIMS